MDIEGNTINRKRRLAALMEGNGKIADGKERFCHVTH